LIDILPLVRKFVDILNVPNLDSAEDVYRWVLEVFELAQDISKLTDTTVDDKVLAAIESLVNNREAMLAFIEFALSLVPNIKAEGEVPPPPDVSDVADVIAECLGGVTIGDEVSPSDDARKIAEIAGIDPLLVIQIAMMIVRLILNLRR